MPRQRMDARRPRPRRPKPIFWGVRVTTRPMTAVLAEPGGHRDAVFGLSRSDGRILMVRNDRIARGAASSWWDLPGGAVQLGESLPKGLRREWREETGLEAKVGELVLVLDGLKRRPEGAPLYTWRAFFFEVRCSGEAHAGRGIDAVAWVPEGQVSGRLEAPYHAALKAFLAGDPARHAHVEWIEAEAEENGAGAPGRHLLILSAAAAVGDRALLKRQVQAALDEGESAASIAEALLQIVPYAGFPRAITALAVARPLLGLCAAQSEAPDKGQAARGAEVFGRVYGETAAAVRAGLERLDPLLAAWTLEFAYGRVLGREGALSLLERELLAVSILTALGGLSDPLLGHMRAALRLGATPALVHAAVQVVPASVGEGRRASAKALLERL